MKIKFLGFITIILNGILASLNLAEYYTVQIKKDTSDYPFGDEGPVPYYYGSQELYSKVVFIWGLIYLVLLLVSIWTTIKDKKKIIRITFITTLILMILDLVQGYY